MKKRALTVLLALLLVAAFAAMAFALTGCNLARVRYDLSRPIDAEDWISVWDSAEAAGGGIFQSPDLRVAAGKPIFDYEAPLENYIEIFTAGRSGEDTVESWLDDSAIASYFLPLYDDHGNRAKALLVWREAHARLFAYGADDIYQHYLDAQESLTHHIAAGATTAGTREHEATTPVRFTAFWARPGIILLAETEDGVRYGTLFSDYNADENLPAQYSLSAIGNTVMTEGEVVDLLRTTHFETDDW